MDSISVLREAGKMRRLRSMRFWTNDTARLKRENEIMRKALGKVAYSMTEVWTQQRMRGIANNALCQTAPPKEE